MPPGNTSPHWSSPPEVAGVIAAERQRIVTAWQARVRGDRHLTLPPDLAEQVLIDHLPDLLDELAACLDRGGPEWHCVDPQPILDPRLYAEERFRSGFSLQDAIRLMGHLRHAIVDILCEHGHALSGQAADDLHDTLDELMARIADAMAWQQNRLLETIVEQSGDGIIVADPDGRIRFFNREAERQHGIGRRDIPTLFLAETYGLVRENGHWASRAETPLFRALHGEHVAAQPVRIHQARGGVRHLEVSAVPLTYPDGSNAGAVLVTRDATERVAQEAERTRLAQFREQLIAIMGHDLRTPLSIIFSSVELLRRSDLRLDQQALLSKVAVSAKRMRRLISDVMDYTRSRLGMGLDLDLRPVDMREFCEQMLDDFRVLETERPFTLEADGDTTGLWDPDRLFQVIANLLRNAVAYSPPGTPIDLRLSGKSDGVILTLSNVGDPIGRAEQRSLFEPFRQPKSGPRREGLGIGLYIVRSILAAHGGRIRIRSANGRNTFRLWWPKQPPIAAGKQAA